MIKTRMQNASGFVFCVGAYGSRGKCLQFYTVSAKIDCIKPYNTIQIHEKCDRSIQRYDTDLYAKCRAPVAEGKIRITCPNPACRQQYEIDI